MSTTIDQRVVEMRFDNKQFESNVQTSLGTISRLKQSLDLSGASKGLENVGTAAKGLNMSGIADAVENVKLKFSAFEIMAVTALANITNSAVNAGKQLINAFTFEPIQTGFDEFELKMGSVQTIMASTGESLETVNGYLDELNKYSDQTIYSFSDMTSNIGKFTNAGVKLEDAVLAIKGVSNEAAVSGANANEASRAMYNFAQALSAGYVKLIDWKSIENANMATVEFKTQLLEAAVASGTVAKTADGMYQVLSTNANGQTMDLAIDATKNFNDSLQYQWMTTDVLVNTLRDYADETTDIGKKAYAAAQDVKTFSMMMDTLKEAAQSGWATTWELIVGDFNEGKALWTEMSQVFGKLIDDSSNARNDLLQGWKDLGGRDELIQSFRNMFDVVANVVTPIKEAFRDIFPRTTSEQLYNITAGLQDLTKKMIPSAETTEKLKSTFRGLFSVLDIVGQAFSAVINALKPLISPFAQLGGSILDITAAIGNWITALDESIKQNETFAGIMNAVSGVTSSFASVVGAVSGKTVSGFSDMTGGIEKFANVGGKLSGTELALNGLGNAASKFGLDVENTSRVTDIFSNALEKGIVKLNDWKSIENAGMATGEFKEQLLNSAVAAGTLEKRADGMYQVISTNAEGGTMDAAISASENFNDSLSYQWMTAEVVNDALGKYSDVTDAAGNAASSAEKKMNPFVEVLSTLFSVAKRAVGVLKSVGTTITGALKTVGASVKKFFSDLNLDTLYRLMNGGILIAVGNSIRKFAGNLESITGTVTDFTGSIKSVFSGVNDVLGSAKSVLDGVKDSLVVWQKDIRAKTLLKIAAAVALLTYSIVALSGIDAPSLAAALTALGGEFAELMLAMNALTMVMNGRNLKGIAKFSALMISTSIAIGLLTSAVVKLALINPAQTIQGLVGVGVLCAELAAFLDKAQMNKMSISSGLGFIALAGALNILGSAVQKIGELDIYTMIQGLAGMAAVLAELVAFTNTVGDSKGILTTSVAMNALGAAMLIFGSAIQKIGGLDIYTMVQGLAGLAAVLAEIVAFTNTVDTSHMMSMSVSMNILGAAMLIFGSAVQKMGEMDLTTLGKGLLGMGSSLAIVAVALKAMPTNTLSVSVGLVAVGAALNLIANAVVSLDSLSWQQMALGLLTLAGALTEIAIATSAMEYSLPGAAALGVVSLALAVLVPSLKSLGSMSLSEVGTSLLLLAGAFTAIGVAGVVLTPITPAILALSAAIAALGIATLACGAGVAAFGTGLTALAVSGTAGITSLVLAIQSIISLIPYILSAVGEGIVAMLTTIGNSASQFSAAIVQIVSAILNAIRGTIPQLIETVILLITTFLSTLAENLPSIIQSGADIILALLNGIRDNIGEIVSTVVDIITEILETIAEKIPDIIQAGFDIVLSLINGMADGIRENTEALREAFWNLCTAMLDAVLGFFGIHSPSTVFADIGKNLILGLIDGLSELINKPVEKVKELAGDMVSGIKEKAGNFLESGKELIENLKSGADTVSTDAVNGVTTIVTYMRDGITGMVSDFQNSGSDLINSFTEGLNKRGLEPKTMFTTILTKVVESVKKKVSDFVSAGKEVVAGFIKGLGAKIDGIKTAATKLATTASDALREKLDINSPSKVFEEIGEYAGQGFVDGLDNYVEEADEAGGVIGYAAMTSIASSVKDGGEEVTAAITENNQETTAETKNFWTNLIATVTAYSAEKTAVENSGVEATKTAAKKTAEVHEEQIAEEDQYWAKLLETKRKGEEADKYQSMQMVDFKKEILNSTVEILKTYTDEVQSTTESLMNSSSMFEDAEKASDLTKNLKEQISELEEYKRTIEELNARITDGGLKDALSQMGVESLDELKLINSMTDAELTDYSNLYDQKYALCQQLAVTQLQGLQTETESKLSELYGGAQVNLEQFSQSFNGTFESIRSYVGESIKIGSELASGVAQGISEGTDQSKTAATEMIKETEAAAKEAADIHSPSGLFRDEVGKNITAGIAEGMSSPESLSLVKESAAELNTAILESFTESNEQFLTAGEEIINACNTGMNSSSDSFTSQCTETIRTALTAMQTSINNSQTSFQTAASGIMSSFVAGVKSKEIESKSLITNVLSGCLTAINNKQTQFHTAGSTLMIKLIGGIKSKDAETQNAIFVIVKACLKKIEDKYFDFRNAGTEAVAHFAAGIKSSESKAEKEFTDLLSVTINTIRGRYKDFSDAGDYLVRGFAAGIDDSTFRAEAAARAMARAAIDAAEEELDENSPSKEGRRIGDYFGLGFVNGIAEYADKAYGVSSDMAGKAKSGLTNAISEIQSMLESGIDTEPTIRPVLDLSDVESKSLRLNSLFSSSMAVRVSNGMNTYRSGNIQNGETTSSSGNSFVFTQNNYSPKALSRSDIYRQTKNQFSAMERMVEV